jgi:N-acyl-D-aspartate/D-glutamate deacylase
LDYVGRTIATLGRQRNADPIDVVCDCLIEDKAATRVLVASISQDDHRRRKPDKKTLPGQGADHLGEGAEYENRAAQNMGQLYCHTKPPSASRCATVHPDEYLVAIVRLRRSLLRR